MHEEDSKVFLTVEDSKVLLTVDDALRGIRGAQQLVEPELADYLEKKLNAFNEIQSGAIDAELVAQGVNPADIHEGDYANILIDDSKNVPVISVPFAGEAFVQKLRTVIREGQKNEQEEMELLKRAQASETPALARKRAAEYSKRDGYKPNLKVVKND